MYSQYSIINFLKEDLYLSEREKEWAQKQGEQ